MAEKLSTFSTEWIRWCPLPVAVVAHEGVIQEANEPLKELLGRENLEGQNLFRLLEVDPTEVKSGMELEIPLGEWEALPLELYLQELPGRKLLVLLVRKEREQRRIGLLEAFARITRVATQIRESPDRLLRSILENLHTLGIPTLFFLPTPPPRAPFDLPEEARSLTAEDLLESLPLEYREQLLTYKQPLFLPDVAELTWQSPVLAALIQPLSQGMPETPGVLAPLDPGDSEVLGYGLFVSPGLKPSEARFFSSFARQVAVSLETTRLFSEVERHNQLLFNLTGLQRALSRYLEPEEMAETLCRSLGETLGDVQVALFLVETGGEPRLLANHPEGQTTFDLQRIRRAAESGGSLEGETELLFPIPIRPDRVMVLAAWAERDRPFSPPDQLILRSVVEYLQALMERSRLFHEVLKAKRDWEATFDAIADGVSLHTPEGQVIRANRALARILNAAHPKELIGRSCVGELHGPDLPHGEETWTQEVQHKDRVFLLSYFPVRDETGALTGFVHVLKDVTELRNMQLQLFQSSKLASIGELAAGVAHEINNPLTAVVGFSELWLVQGVPIPDLEADLRKIHEAGKRASEIVRNLLAFARAQRDLRKEYFDLNEAVENALALVEQGFEKENVKLIRDFHQGPLYLEGHKGQIQQVVLNLVQNAKDAILLEGKGDQVVVRTRPLAGGKQVLLEVEDNGPGIPEKVLDRIFNPFFTTKPPGKGTGLGLAITRRIVTDHGGKIEYRPAPGGGSIFAVTLPGVIGTKAMPQTEEAAQRQVGGKRVLVIDDEEVVLDFLRKVLEARGNEVRGCRRAEEALDLLRRGESFDRVYLDLLMPGLSGMEFYRILQKERPDLAKRVVVITGDILRKEVRDFLKETGLPVLTKPISIRELFESLDKETQA